MKHSPHLIALDAGTTAVKTVLFSADGREVAAHACEYPLQTPAADRVEADPEAYWQAACQGIASVLRQSGVNGEAVAAVGVTSQGESVILLDAHGQPLRPAMVWLDQRAVAETALLAARFSRQQVYARTGQPEIVPTWTAAKLLWLKRHEPDIFARTKKIVLVADYLVYRLSGRFASDHALNPSTLYYDLTRGAWWDEMLDFIGLKPGLLPELCPSGTAVGPVTAAVGLGAATLVTTAPIDQIAAALGAGNVAPGMVTETTGSAMALCATVSTPCHDPAMQIGLYRHAIPGHYVLMPWVPTAGMVLRWFRDELGGGAGYPELSALAAPVPAGSDGLLVLPHFSGSFAPAANPAARGVFYGLTLAHGRGHLVRAIFEAVAYMLRDNLELLEKLGAPCAAIRSLGGGARDPLWLQIKADVLNRSVIAPDGAETTSLGAAIAAAVAAGLQPSLAAATAAMVRPGRPCAPNPAQAARYEQSYQAWRRLNDLLIPTFGESHA